MADNLEPFDSRSRNGKRSSSSSSLSSQRQWWFWKGGIVFCGLLVMSELTYLPLWLLGDGDDATTMAEAPDPVMLLQEYLGKALVVTSDLKNQNKAGATDTIQNNTAGPGAQSNQREEELQNHQDLEQNGESDNSRSLALGPPSVPTADDDLASSTDTPFFSFVDKDDPDNHIRRWGCKPRTETPFVFVHIGKAGGGGVRARFSAAALNYTRSAWYRTKEDDAYYPIRRRFTQSFTTRHSDGSETTTTTTTARVVARATFCNWAFSGFDKLDPRSCVAVTPIGQAVGCPEVQQMCGHNKSAPQTEHLVYAGHNVFGHDLHWLPVPYLQRWWRQHWAAKVVNTTTGEEEEDEIAKLWPTLDGETPWVRDYQRPLANMSRGAKNVKSLRSVKRLQRRADDLSMVHFGKRKHVNLTTAVERGRAWSNVYASLPVLRVTMVREPFSWLLSKFFWHGLAAPFDYDPQAYTCDNITAATYGSNQDDITLGIVGDPGKRSKGEYDLDARGLGWARRFAITYLHYLCGADCMIRHYKKRADLLELETQAEYNLRQGFAVVGLLEETDSFYEMVSARVDYMDTSLNPHVKGSSHKSGGSSEATRCKRRFKDADLQKALMEASPEIAALVRLHKVAVEVNRFQKAELDTCRRQQTPQQ